MTSDTRYWAALEPEELIRQLDGKAQQYRSALERMGFPCVWRLSYSQFYGMDPARPGHLDAQQVGFSGSQGQNIVFRINDFRSFVKQSATLAIGQRPSFRCLAVNDDFDSMAQVETCDSALTYVYNRSYGEDLERSKVEIQKIYGWAWDWHRWDDDGGDDVEVPPDDPEGMTLEQKRSGAPTITPLSPYEVAHDTSCKDGRHTWVIATERRSKWELAAQYPTGLQGEDQVEQILGLTTEGAAGFTLLGGGGDQDWMIDPANDAVLVRHFYHARTKALPDGRYVGIAGGLVLWDWPLPSEELPLVQFMPARINGTSFGYSDAWDLLPIQQMIDQLVSDQATNAAIFGRPNVVMDEGTTITVTDLAAGGHLFTKKPGTEMPQVVQYQAATEQPLALLRLLYERYKENYGLNSVVRGDPAANIKSGTYAALMHSTALEFASADQQAVDASRTHNANLTLANIKNNARYPFVIEVAGESEKAYASSFDTDKFRAVKRVQVVTASPLQRTQAGRLEIYDRVKDITGPDGKPAFSDPSQVIELLVSGQWKPMYRAGRDQKLRVKWENEQLAKGIHVPVMAGQDPYAEVAEHLAVLANPAALNDPNVVAAVGQHVMEHEEVYLQMSPILCAFLKIPPPPMMPGMDPSVPSPDADGDTDASPPGESDGPGKKQMQRAASAEMSGNGVPLPKPARSPVEPPQVAA